MDFHLNPGITGKQEITVEPKDTATHYGSGSIDVFATPAMVALMEMTALQSVQDFLPEGYTTVGTEISVTHERATPVGTKVSCESVLEEADGRRLLFSVKTFDEKALIGQGMHRRYIVEAERFMQKLKESY